MINGEPYTSRGVRTVREGVPPCGGLPHDIQICLGCNDQMTAEYISEKCGTVTIGVKNNQFPLMPLFSPVYSSTRPYSQTRSNTQRLLMMPDEILQMDNRKCLVFLRGQKPMLLHKIIPDEFMAFSKLRFTPVQEHIPTWREILAQKRTYAPPKDMPQQPQETAPTPAPAPASDNPPVSYDFNPASLKSQPPSEPPPTPPRSGRMVAQSLDSVRGD